MEFVPLMNTRCTNETTLAIAALALASAVGVLYGCETAQDADDSRRTAAAPAERHVADHERHAQARRDGEPVATVVDARPAAMIQGRSITWGELRPMLNERAGAEIIQEVALDRVLMELTSERGIAISADDIARERRLMLDLLDPDDPNRAVRLLRELRARSGLGQHRFEALLRRNASLRALVHDRVQMSEEAVRQMFDTVHGPRRQVRLMTLPSLSDVKLALDRIKAGETFGDVAVDVSTDGSASRGGLLEPISRFDPSYPDSFRRAVWELAPGEISSPLLLDEQYAVLQLVREIDGDDVELEDVRDAMERRVRLSQERVRMDQLARSLIADVSITIFDRSLRESWEMRRGREE